MQVTCSRCGAAHRISADFKVGQKLRFRCKRCEHKGPAVVEETPEAAEAPQEYDRKEGWFFVRNGGQEGPTSLEELGRMLGAGELTAESYVWHASLPNWTFVRDVETLAPLLSRAERQPSSPEEESDDQEQLFAPDDVGGDEEEPTVVIGEAGAAEEEMDFDVGISASEPSGESDEGPEDLLDALDADFSAALEETSGAEQTAAESVGEPAEEQPAEPVEEPVEQVVEEAVDDVSESLPEPLDKPATEILMEAGEVLDEDISEALSEDASEKPLEEVVERPVETPAEEPADEAAEAPISLEEEPADEAAEAPISLEEEPADEAAEPPISLEEEPADKAASGPREDIAEVLLRDKDSDSVEHLRFGHARRTTTAADMIALTLASADEVDARLADTPLPVPEEEKPDAMFPEEEESDKPPARTESRVDQLLYAIRSEGAARAEEEEWEAKGEHASLRPSEEAAGASEADAEAFFEVGDGAAVDPIAGDAALEESNPLLAVAPPPRRSRAWLWILVLLVAGAAGAAVVYFMTQERGEATEAATPQAVAPAAVAEPAGSTDVPSKEEPAGQVAVAAVDEGSAAEDTAEAAAVDAEEESPPDSEATEDNTEDASPDSGYAIGEEPGGTMETEEALDLSVVDVAARPRPSRASAASRKAADEPTGGEKKGELIQGGDKPEYRVTVEPTATEPKAASAVSSARINRLIQRKLRQFSRCKRGSQTTKVTMTLTIKTDGSVGRVDVGLSPSLGRSADRALKDCVRDIVSKWVFPAQEEALSFRRVIIL